MYGRAIYVRCVSKSQQQQQKKEQTKMGNKTWTDQPDEVLEAETVLGSFTVVTTQPDGANATVEVRRKSTGYPNRPYDYYVSFGGLFGSQTIVCKTAEQVLACLCNVGPDRTLPNGVRILPNKESSVIEAPKESVP